jgi:bacterioferritin-associated ferredoxin
MYVCICRAIRERDVEAAVRAGARKPIEIFRACGTSAQCGTCASDMRERIGRTIADDADLPRNLPAAAD